MNEIIVLCTVDSAESGERIAAALVESRDAACVNIISGVRSIYRWEGKLCRDAEFLLVIKSVADKFEAVREQIRRMHTYQVPEVIAVPIAFGDADYLSWLRESVN
ncbi:MAG: divalent-cation tolerance protein CutA [Acidobacteriota bacterium]|jgi:periplasmic divalent cation tolerance protein|nr:divalent-cation tolerance protein CutA [Acidobacteriota bacterium]